MTDLRGWIRQQIAERETAARHHEQPSPTWEYDDLACEVHDEANSGTVAFVPRHGTGRHIALNNPAAVLRRCAADRKILARHNVDLSRANDRLYATACDGCGTYGDCDDPVTDNINDCPELLDLADGYGINDDDLAALDRPRPPTPRPPHPGGFPGMLADAFAAAMRTPLADVPPALRGPNWPGPATRAR